MENTFHIQWHITDSCNLRCKHCYQNNFSSEKDLSFEKLLYIFSNICEFLEKENKKLIIDITGGEPFLHKNMWELIEVILNSKKTKNLGIITNGLYLSNEVIYKIEKNEVILKISTEAVDKELYEFFRGKKFEKFIGICEKVKEIKSEKFLMFTILEKNWQQIFKIFDFAKKYNFSGVILERFIPYGLGEKLKNDVITFENWLFITKYLHKICKIKFDIFDIVEYRGFMVKIEEREFQLYGSECIVGKDGIAVMPNGTVFPCRRFPLSIGNLLEQKLIDIWQSSEILNKIRDKSLLKGECKNCKINKCIGCRALAYSLYNDFLEEDPLCYLKVI
ncbi:MAG: radical SAM protein [Candidatus Ratteibacteria bacterium]